MPNIEPKNDISKLYKNIKTIIDSSKERATIALNNTMILSYWEIGERLKKEILKDKRATYGQEVVKRVSEKLTLEYGRGYSRSNLERMMKLYTLFDKEICATLSHKLSWSHFIEFIKIKDNELKREFYIAMSTHERWNVRTLRERINSMLFERTAISKKPEKTIRQDLQALSNKSKMSTSLFLKDPCLLNFLELEESYSERDLENAILIELEKFILEFGSDFAFLARQKRIQIGNNDYVMDLLFYHRKLKRLVLIELKIGEFEPQYKGQVELYLKWLSKYEKQEDEQEPIAIILCASKDSEVVELMDLERDNIHVSEYWLQLPPRELLEQKLYRAIEHVKSLEILEEELKII
jgi:predicted nuclease of restriction endonuclease-like (RecB) superfamily